MVDAVARGGSQGAVACRMRDGEIAEVHDVAHVGMALAEMAFVDKRIVDGIRCEGAERRKRGEVQRHL